MEIEKIYNRIKPYIELIETDTRKLKNNGVFFALKGDSFNGNLFASKALKMGASFVIVDELHELPPENQVIFVDNVLICLQKIAAFHRSQMSAKLIGITGTNGKTTTKELIKSVLSAKYQVLATEGNLNNHIGVPLTLLKIRPKHKIAIIEMGANHPGEIKLLASLAQPDLGLVTNVGKAHLEGFGSFEGVIKTKKELYDQLAEEGKPAFVFSDQNELLEMSGQIAQRLFYSLEDQEAWCYGKWYSKNENIHMEWRCNGVASEVVSPLFGKYNAINILAAVCIGNYFKLSPEQIEDGIRSYIPENNRSQKLRTAKGNNIILDAYNANPVSMALAIESFLEQPVKKPCLILGDMFELGDYSRNEHAAIIDLLLSHKDKFEMAILAGKHFQAVQKDDPQLVFFESREEIPASSVLSSFVNKNILIKGSRGMKLETLLNYL